MDSWKYLLSGDSHREPGLKAETELNNDEEVESNLSDLEEKLYRRCFDKVDDLCGYDQLDVGEEMEQLDKRRDGLISVVKLQKIISRLEHEDNLFYMGPVVRKMDRRKERHLLKQSLHEVDTNHDGYISYEEYKQFVLKMRRGHIFTTQVSRYERIIEYFHTIGHGRHINKWPPPVFIPGVTILQISFFIAYKLHEDVDDSVRDVFNSFEFDPSQRHQVWRYITYSCVHIEWQHLIINMSLQLLVGIILESVHKWWRVAPVYILGVLPVPTKLDPE